MAALPQSRYDLLAAEHKTLSDSVTQNDGKRHPIESYEGYKSLIARAADVFGSELIAARWLSMPSADFNGKVPLEVAQLFDYRESQLIETFEPVFMRIEHGIYT